LQLTKNIHNFQKLNTMPKEYIKIELTENDIKQLVAEKYNLDINRTTINVSHYGGDAREPAYTCITVTGQR
jgi:hypothetical protein